MHNTRIILLLACCLLAACGGDKDAAGKKSGTDDALPKPDAVSGSVTGMPTPGTPTPVPQQPVDAPPEIALDTPPAGEAAQLGAAEPGAGSDAAMAVLRQYYLAINARDYATAYAQWSDGGRASGQSPQQFSNGFTGTEGVSAELGTPGPVEGAAGSRYVQIPVSLQARMTDGTLQHFAGSYTLRMSVVDGATAAQRSWHIASASLREIVP